MSTASSKTARDLMTTQVIGLAPTDSVRKAIEVLIQYKISGAPVLEPDTQKLLGVVSEYDLILAMHSVGGGMDVSSAMHTRVHTVPPDTSLDELSTLMLERKIRRFPVVDDQGCVLGIVARRDILRAYLDARPSIL